MDNEHQPLAVGATSELYSQDAHMASESAFSHESTGISSKPRGDGTPWYVLPKRYVIAIMAFLGFANIYALRVNLSVAIVAMTTNKSVYINGTYKIIGDPDFVWSNHLKGQILASFFYGYIFTQLPGGYLANRLGGKYVFGVGVLVTALLTLPTPLFTTISPYMLIGARVVEGLFEGVTYPAIHALWSKWAPREERTKLVTFGFSGSYFGTVIALTVSGYLAESTAEWQSIFYLFGSVAIVWFLLWVVLVTESPVGHPGITESELDYIQDSIGYDEDHSKRVHPPWRQILTSAPVWAIAAAHFTENWGFYTWLTELPSFMTHVLDFHMEEGGTLSALPYLVMGIVVCMGGYFADVLRTTFSIPTVVVRKGFTCGAFAVQAIFMVAAGYLESRGAAVACLTLAVGVGGLAWSGFSVNHLDIAPPFASVLMGLSNTIATLPGILSPGLTSLVVEDQGSQGQWQIVFYLAAGIYALGGVVYGVFGSASVQPWASPHVGYSSHLDDPDGPE